MAHHKANLDNFLAKICTSPEMFGKKHKLQRFETSHVVGKIVSINDNDDQFYHACQDGPTDYNS